MEARSLARFMIGLIEGERLTPASFAKMLAPQVELPEDHVFVFNIDTEAWALGFGVVRTDYGLAYSHGGNNGDFQSWFQFDRPLCES